MKTATTKHAITFRTFKRNCMNVRPKGLACIGIKGDGCRHGSQPMAPCVARVCPVLKRLETL